MAGNGGSLCRFYYVIVRAVTFTSEGDEKTLEIVEQTFSGWLPQ